jgi:hypothetical protein
MNVYKKYCASVYVAMCDEKYKKDDIITLETRRGGSHQCIIWNYLGERNGKSFYSITRADGFNAKKRIENKIEKTKKYQDNARARSSKHSELSNRDRDFLSLGEPIKVGHHSEKRHRNIIKYACNQADKALEESRKAESYEDKIENLKSRIKNIDLSTPESLEYYKEKLEKAVLYHKKLKSGELEKEHSYSIRYALQDIKKLKIKARLAVKLWSTDFINNDSSDYQVDPEGRAKRKKEAEKAAEQARSPIAFEVVKIASQEIAGGGIKTFKA